MVCGGNLVLHCYTPVVRVVTDKVLMVARYTTIFILKC